MKTRISYNHYNPHWICGKFSDYNFEPDCKDPDYQDYNQNKKDQYNENDDHEFVEDC